MTLALRERVCLMCLAEGILKMSSTHLCSGELSIISSSCVTPSRTSTVAARTCRRRLTPDTHRRSGKKELLQVLLVLTTTLNDKLI